METFVEKVCYGSGPHFNSILEEIGRWISKEAQRHDMEMAGYCYCSFRGSKPSHYKGYPRGNGHVIWKRVATMPTRNNKKRPKKKKKTKTKKWCPKRRPKRKKIDNLWVVWKEIIILMKLQLIQSTHDESISHAEYITIWVPFKCKVLHNIKGMCIYDWILISTTFGLLVALFKV